MGQAYRILPYYTYQDYLRWEGQWELIEGIPYAMSPAPTPRHQWVAGNLHAEFRAALKKNKCNCKVYQPIDYKIAEDTIFNPDLLIACKPLEKNYLDFPPALVVEILSPATALKDRNTKFQRYEQEGIRYYLMIDADTEVVEIYMLNDGHYQKQELVNEHPFTFQFDHCEFSIRFSDIWE